MVDSRNGGPKKPLLIEPQKYAYNIQNVPPKYRVGQNMCENMYFKQRLDRHPGDLEICMILGGLPDDLGDFQLVDYCVIIFI